MDWTKDIAYIKSSPLQVVSVKYMYHSFSIGNMHCFTMSLHTNIIRENTICHNNYNSRECTTIFIS